ncbi:MAG: hypothetical protein ACXVPU_01230 [Bacteroidia bacterium]
MKKKSAFIFILVIASFMMSFIENKYECSTETELARSANKFMWDNFHLGNYDSIPAILKKLDEANSYTPEDYKIIAHLGFIHLWAFCERGRKAPDSSVTEHIYLSNYFFKKAIELNPNDPRIRGFQSSTDICEGALSENLLLIIKGYLNGLRSIKKWPTFNRSAVSFIESQRDSSSRMFKQGIKYQWKVIDECSCKKLDKKTIMASPQKVIADMISEVRNSQNLLIKRACWNSWIAPHNLEGFFLNFGDMLVKEGHSEEAKEMYSAAKLSPAYNDWAYKQVLEDRIKNIESDKKIFNKKLKLIYRKNEKQIFINSKISCVACHQMSKKEFEKAGYREPTDETYFIKK